jgi:hypothetical protein
VLPSWVQHRDGRRVPFDGDIISRNLFAAAQALGSPDAFLIRELTDGILHFLEQEDLGDIAPARRIDEVTEKIVAQFGHAQLAHAFGQRTAPESGASEDLVIPVTAADRPADVAARCLDTFALRRTFTPDVAAAHEQGLIVLGGLQTPDLLDAVVLKPASHQGRPFDNAWSLVADGAKQAGRMLVVDGPEWTFPDMPAAAIGDFIDGLAYGALAYARQIEIHLNTASLPTALRDLASGPLFTAATGRPGTAHDWLRAAAQRPHLHVAWHWRGAEDMKGARAVVFDRPPFVSLGSGLTRNRTAVSLTVGLDLLRLLNRLDVACQGDRFLEKLPSLSRLAVSAGVQKRAYLRRSAGPLTREFLLDRAAVRIVPLGFADVLRQLLGVAAPITRPARLLANKILHGLGSCLDKERRRTSLDLLVAAPVERLDVAFTEDHLTQIGEMLDGVAEEGRAIIVGEEWSSLAPFVAAQTALTEIRRDAEPA